MASRVFLAVLIGLAALELSHSFLPQPSLISARVGYKAASVTLRHILVSPLRMAEGGSAGSDSDDDKLKSISEQRGKNLDISDEAWKDKMAQVEEMKRKEQEVRALENRMRGPSPLKGSHSEQPITKVGKPSTSSGEYQLGNHAAKALPKVGGVAPSPSSKRDDTSSAPSFMSSANVEASKQVRMQAEAEAESRAKQRLSIQDMEIDPRGFIVPKVGDIVLCPGKWANQDMVGLVEATQFVDNRMSWNVDVIELTEVAPRTYGKAFSAWKKPVKTWFDVSEVRPARAQYSEDQDGWIVENVRDLYTNPVAVNETAREMALLEYSELKAKILKDTAVIGVGISAALLAVDPDMSFSFAIGSVASIAYLVLLTKQVDEFGPGGLGVLGPRLLAPMGLFAVLYAKWAITTEGAVWGDFPALPPKDIAASAIGFLAYKAPLLYESSKQIADSLEDAGEGLESGVSQGYKQWQSKVKSNVEEARIRESNPETTLNPFTKIRLVVTKKIEDDAKEKMKEMEMERRMKEKDE